MAKLLLLANIGNRDVFLSGQEIRPARTKGKEILDNFTTHRQEVSLPILDPVMRYIQAEHPTAQLDLMLFCTNQEDADEKYKGNDTLHLGECIKKLLSGQQPVGKVTVREIQANPNLADSMFHYFSDQLSRMRKHSEEYEKIFVALAGGIPACNMALCLQAVRFFEERSVPLYPLEGSGQPVPLQIGQQLLDSAKRETIRRQLENDEYAVAVVLLDSLGLTLYANLARMALYRLNFDFQRAKTLAARLVAQDLGEVRSYGRQVEGELKNLLEKDLSRLILELYHNASIKFRKGEYLDFLGRLFRFQEAVLRYLVETSELALQTDIDSDKHNFAAFQASVRGHPDLVTYLEQQTYGTDKLDWDKPYVPCLTAILGYLAEQGTEEKRGQRADILSRLREIERLMPLRHRSPLGHGFEGVSLEKIHEQVAGFSPERLRDITRAIGLAVDVDKEGNPYDKVKALIEKALA